MFPFDLEDEEEIEIEEQKEPKDWEIDFKTGKLTDVDPFEFSILSASTPVE